MRAANWGRARLGVSATARVLVCAAALGLLAGCAAGTTVSLTDPALPAEAAWDGLPEAVRTQWRASAEAADSTQQLDRPPYPVGGMRGLMAGLTYPSKARKAAIEGQVVVRAVVSAEGVVESTSVVQSVHPLLDAEAVAAVRRARFDPAERDGRPVSAAVCAPFRFALR